MSLLPGMMLVLFPPLSFLSNSQCGHTVCATLAWLLPFYVWQVPPSAVPSLWVAHLIAFFPHPNKSFPLGYPVHEYPSFSHFFSMSWQVALSAVPSLWVALLSHFISMCWQVSPSGQTGPDPYLVHQHINLHHSCCHVLALTGYGFVHRSGTAGYTALSLHEECLLWCLWFNMIFYDKYQMYY